MKVWRVAEVVGRLPYASNATLLGRLDDGTLVVYKPVLGERPLWDFPTGSLAVREALTYTVSESLGFGIVPETVMGDGPHGRGSLQRYIDEDLEFNPAGMINRADPALWPVAVMDLLINNADRKAGHVLREVGSEQLWCIDHGVSFHKEPKLRTVLWGFAGSPLPDAMVDALGTFLAGLHAGLCEQVAELLSNREAAALLSRTEELLANPVHPEPPEDRPALPWPLW
jgi:hypothetical protein